MLYFDHNATHSISATAKRVWLEAVEKFSANASSPHRLGQRAETALDDARGRLAKLLGCSAEEIVFTSGATESANTVMTQFNDIWVSAIEHPCVLESPRRARTVPVLASGVVDVGWLVTELTRTQPALMAVMAANNETGVQQPWQILNRLCRQVRVLFFCDAAQWIGKLPARGLGECDFVSGCAHKFGGPQGVGFLKCPRGFSPLLRGGPQENGRRAGTENVAGILAMVAALEEREAAMSTTNKRAAWRDDFEKELCSALPTARVLGAEAPRLWNTSSVIMPEQPDCRRRWVVVMDRLGFAVSTGSACASGKEKPSHVLTAMSIPPDAAGRALRFSAGWETTSDDWARLFEGAKSAAREMGCA